MNCINNQKAITIGVNTGKSQLGIFIRPLDIYFMVKNDEKGIKEAIKNKIEKVDDKLSKLIEKCSENKAKNTIIQSMPALVMLLHLIY